MMVIPRFRYLTVAKNRKNECNIFGEYIQLLSFSEELDSASTFYRIHTSVFV
jgi:hypothetical protein